MIKKALEIVAGDRFLDAGGKEWQVLEVRRDPFANGPRWIVIRVQTWDGTLENPPIDTEICCSSYEQFTMVQPQEVR